jgi:trimethyllysine dioxygenase
LIERIAFIRETHYGNNSLLHGRNILTFQGGFYDFTSDLTMKDTAYTDLALSPHTDTTYFTDPAGLQMFHLLSHTEGSGGETVLIDGFNAANRLLKESPRDYKILATTPVVWHASGNPGITITPSRRFPVLNLKVEDGPDTIFNLLQIRWNNADRGWVPAFNNHIPVADRWYKAARKFDEILKSESMQYWTQLKPGRPLIFDNWRVLHGRSQFTGKRRMCGAYSKSCASTPGTCFGANLGSKSRRFHIEVAEHGSRKGEGNEAVPLRERSAN